LDQDKIERSHFAYTLINKDKGLKGKKDNEVAVAPQRK